MHIFRNIVFRNVAHSGNMCSLFVISGEFSTRETMKKVMISCSLNEQKNVNVLIVVLFYYVYDLFL